MEPLHAHRWPGFRLLLGAALIVVQLGALAHTLQHEFGAPQDRVCLSCLAAQPAHGGPVTAVWSVPVNVVDVPRSGLERAVVVSQPVLFARQRAPPVSL